MIIEKACPGPIMSVLVALIMLVLVGPLNATKTKSEDDPQSSISPPATLSMRSAPPGDRELFSGEALSDCCFNFFVLLLRPVIGKGPEDMQKECEDKIK